MPQLNRIMPGYGLWQEQYLLLYLWGQKQQVHDLYSTEMAIQVIPVLLLVRHQNKRALL